MLGGSLKGFRVVSSPVNIVYFAQLHSPSIFSQYHPSSSLRTCFITQQIQGKHVLPAEISAAPHITTSGKVNCNYLVMHVT